ncbi:uncharacterized protein LOC109532249 [Hippocampus comes]|uniref:uncharacterized protein LOC109532249 n=1 Tax=Hippocampus comes TaxID=109280 RepID=UPI00094E8388|nr:PREDICTED: uncharacterized protein LOC109532249 [Hippocampus comes]
MCAISVKEEYEEELCRLKENDGQRLLSDAVVKTPRVVSHRADHTKKHQEPQCPSIKKEVEEESPHIKEEEEPGHQCAGSHQDSLLAPRSDCDISSHPSDSDTDDERSKGFINYTGTTSSAGIGCGKKDRTATENATAIPEVDDEDNDGIDSSTSTKEELSVCEINTEEQSSLSLEMLDEDQHPPADSFSYTEEAFVCQMHKKRSGESFHSRELPQHQRDLIVERYQSGEGYKKISKALSIPWSTVKSVIVKWRKNGTTVPLPRTGRPSKIDEKTRRELVREAVRRPTATLKELQEFLASTGCSVHVTTISRLLHMSGLWGRVAR